MPVSSQQGSCCPNNFVGFCLDDGTPIALVVDGGTQTGWINLLTGIFTAGPPPAGTIICGDGEASAIVTRIPASITTTVLLAANPIRRTAIFWNDSNAVALLKFGPAASPTSFTWKIGPQSGYELPEPVFTGIISAVWEATTGAIQITEEF